MSASLNKVLLLGHLGKKPEIKYLPNGKAVASFSIATNDGKDKPPEWHNIIAWEKTAENCTQYLDKGSQVLVEGSLQTRSWEDKKTGEKRYKTEIVAYNVKFLGGAQSRSAEQAAPAKQPVHEAADDEIPF